MREERDRPGESGGPETEEYPAGSEVPAEPAGVGDGVEEGEQDQPGLAEDPPQAD